MREAALLSALLSSLISVSLAQSMLIDPAPTAPRACAVGGARGPDRALAMTTCQGPCDVSPPEFLRTSSPGSPAATYSRGETVTIRYSRDPRAQGGFIRLTLVPLDSTMDKMAHASNAFHYSCWGAGPELSAPGENGTNTFYETNVTIPTVAPNGPYILGWAWYGGMTPSHASTTASPGLTDSFGDYWSCSFVRIRGGPSSARFRPVFVNDMADVSPVGCFSASDQIGQCPIEPCQNVMGEFRTPRELSTGGNELNIDQFRRPSCSGRRVRGGYCEAIPTPLPLNNILQEALALRFTCKYPTMRRQPFMFT